MEVSSDPLEDDLGLVLEPVSVLVPPEEVELAEGEVVICWPGDTSSELRPPDTQHILAFYLGFLHSVSLSRIINLCLLHI